MTLSNADRVRKLLNGIETGDPESVEVISPETYIQHNPQTHEGREGLAALFQRLSKTNPRVKIVRAFEDGDYVFGHTEYDFATRRIGFEVFRFEDGLAVEHWDNIQPRKGPNLSGREMTEGPIEATDLAQTEENRDLVRRFVAEVMIERRLDLLTDFIHPTAFAQHSPELADGIEPLRAALLAETEDGPAIVYDRTHRVLAQGNFALAVSEGHLRGRHTAFYDLYRVADGMIVEHWDTVEAVPPASEWKNDNGKF